MHPSYANRFFAGQASRLFAKEQAGYPFHKKRVFLHSLECTLEDYRPLPSDTEKLLKNLKLVFPFGWMVLNAYSSEYTIKYEKIAGPFKEKIEAALQPCFNQVDSLDDGLTKYAGVLFICKRFCSSDGQLNLLVREGSS